MKRTCIIMMMSVLFVCACATKPADLQYPAVRWLKDNDNAKITLEAPKAKKKKDPGSSQKIDQMTEQAQQLLQFTEDIAAAPKDISLGGRIEALNVNNFDEVADSTWFTNRIGRTGALSNVFDSPPKLKSRLKVLEIKEGASSPQFLIKDAKKDIYLVKLDNDPRGLDSGVELIGALILSNAGYNVTENYIIKLNNSLLDKPILAPGEHRALAIKIPKGTQLGHFIFQGKRKDDTNDRIPHEHMRELRGLKVFAAFLNNYDIGTDNTLDIYNGYITHYLTNIKAPLANLRAEFTGGAPAKQNRTIDALFSFGFYNPYWTSADAPQKRKGDIITSAKFDPDDWQPKKNNTAFKYMTDRDSFWAAKILSGFQDKDIKTIVSAADYKDHDISAKIIRELIIRRDKITSYYFGLIPPLDDIKITSSNSATAVSFSDMANTTGTKYRYRMRDLLGERTLLDWTETNALSFALPGPSIEKMKAGAIYKIQLQLMRPGAKWWSNSVNLLIRKDAGPILLGIERP